MLIYFHGSAILRIDCGPFSTLRDKDGLADGRLRTRVNIWNTGSLGVSNLGIDFEGFAIIVELYCRIELGSGDLDSFCLRFFPFIYD